MRAWLRNDQDGSQATGTHSGDGGDSRLYDRPCE